MEATQWRCQPSLSKKNFDGKIRMSAATWPRREGLAASSFLYQSADFAGVPTGI
jgi:hypothetical protein